MLQKREKGKTTALEKMKSFKILNKIDKNLKYIYIYISLKQWNVASVDSVSLERR